MDRTSSQLLANYVAISLYLRPVIPVPLTAAGRVIRGLLICLWDRAIDCGAAGALQNAGYAMVHHRFCGAVGNIQNVFWLELDIAFLTVHDFFERNLGITIVRFFSANEPSHVAHCGRSRLASCQRNSLKYGHLAIVFHDKSAWPAHISNHVNQAGPRDDDLVARQELHVGR